MRIKDHRDPNAGSVLAEYQPKFNGPQSTGSYASSYKTTTDPFEALDFEFEGQPGRINDVKLPGVF
jgi:hypothetical protein